MLFFNKEKKVKRMVKGIGLVVPIELRDLGYDVWFYAVITMLSLYIFINFLYKVTSVEIKVGKGDIGKFAVVYSITLLICYISGCVMYYKIENI